MRKVYARVGAPKVFALSTPADLLKKLRWEILNFQRPTRSEDRRLKPASAYHAFNCAVTAWQMTDWVWEYMGPPGQAHLAANFPLAQAHLHSFQDAVALASRSLNSCREIANRSKHRVVKRKRADPHVVAGLLWHEVQLRSGDPIGMARYRLSWAICDQVGNRPAVEVFKETAEYWQDFLQRWLFEATVPGRRASSGRPPWCPAKNWRPNWADGMASPRGTPSFIYQLRRPISGLAVPV
jgi:hypothetical protein